MTKPPLERRALTVPEAAKVLGIGRSHAYAAARDGNIPTIKIGRRTLVPVAALERRLEDVELVERKPEGALGHRSEGKRKLSGEGA